KPAPLRSAPGRRRLPAMSPERAALARHGAERASSLPTATKPQRAAGRASGRSLVATIRQVQLLSRRRQTVTHAPADQHEEQRDIKDRQKGRGQYAADNRSADRNLAVGTRS